MAADNGCTTSAPLLSPIVVVSAQQCDSALSCDIIGAGSEALRPHLLIYSSLIRMRAASRAFSSSRC
jgi:hypothetical protein